MATIAVQSTPSSSNYIPPEITDQIIDHLHDDVKDLASCSTVAKTWLPVSRYHLFRQVHLHGANVAQLISLLDSPHSSIGPHIHVVKVAWNRKVLEYSRFQRIVTLPAVSMLHFYNVAWVDISEETRPFPLDGLPGITVLRMTDTRVTPSEFIYLLRAFPSLQVVQMEDFRWVNDGHIFPSENTVNLRKLHIGGLYKVDMLDWLMSSPDVWRLDSFKVGFNGGSSEMPKVLEFMQMQKPYLKDFVVSFSVPSMIPKFDQLFYETFRFNDFPQLRSIELPVDTVTRYCLDEFLAPVMSNLPSSIQTIAIRLLVSPDDDLEWLDWPGYIALFTTPKFSSLRRVQIWPEGLESTKKNVDVEGIVADIKRKLANLGASSIFVVAPITNWDLDLL